MDRNVRHKLFLNDKPLDAPAEPGTFCAIRRRWKNNDMLQVKFPLDLRTEAIDDQHPKTVAVMRGPVMLVAVDAPQALIDRPLALPENAEAGSPQSPGLRAGSSRGKTAFGALLFRGGRDLYELPYQDIA